MEKTLKTMLRPLLWCRSLCEIVFNMAVAHFVLPEITERTSGTLSLRGVSSHDAEKINDIYKATLGNGKKLRLYPYIILKTCGRRTAFIMYFDNQICGYMFFYFHFLEFIKYRRIHCASAALLPEYRKGANALYLYFSAWDWLKTQTPLRGISSRYILSNKPARMLHKAYRFEEAEFYHDKDGEEWCYAVKTFSKES